MWLSLLGTGFLMGLAGGPHCLAMCATPCTAVALESAQDRQTISLRAVDNVHTRRPGQRRVHRWLQFHLGRLLGYGALGAAAAYAFGALAWFADRTSILYPVWVLMHLAALTWGLLLLFQARQPRWVEQCGRRLWQSVRGRLQSSVGALGVGVMWALLPCGLLYSAVTVAALAGEVLLGAASMVAFGVGSGLWLLAGAWLWKRIPHLPRWREAWGMRAAGAMLAAVSLVALWLDVAYSPSQWCR